MNNETPKVSVTMSVYNGAPYLDETIQSILNQTFSDFEFLIIDDGSSDKSIEILKKYAKIDSRIKLTCRENKGNVLSLNEMIQYARGEYIARMDHDDVSMPNRFELQVQFMDTNKDVLALGTAAQIIDDKSRYITTLHLPEEHDEIQSDLLGGHCPLIHASAMIRTEALLNIGGYDPYFNIAEDYHLWLVLGEKGKIRNLPIPLIQYRDHVTSISSHKQKYQMEKTRESCELAWARRGIKGNFTATEFRPTDKKSLIERYLKFGWWAFNSNEHKTAFIYAVKALPLKFWSLNIWKLLASSIFKNHNHLN